MQLLKIMVLRLILAKIHMVTKQADFIKIAMTSLILAKIHMVTKHGLESEE